MTSKNWYGRFAAVCATISLLAGHAVRAQEPAQLPAPPPRAAKTPAIALVDPADAEQWKTWAKDLGWLVLTPPAGNTAVDTRVEALASAVRDAIRKGAADPTRIYVAGRGEWAALVFYTISRIPDLWAAGLALGGSPQPAIDSDRLFTANFTNVPVLWVSAGQRRSGPRRQVEDRRPEPRVAIRQRRHQQLPSWGGCPSTSATNIPMRSTAKPIRPPSTTATGSRSPSSIPASATMCFLPHA